MIYRFRMIFSEDGKFIREYELDGENTFLDFHSFIQKNLDFESSQLASFFLTDEYWNKGLELTLIDMENDAGPVAIPMESVKLQDLLKHKKERLLYVFDIFSDRCFFIELHDITKPDPHKHCPICTASAGDAPDQLSLEGIDPNINISDFDDDTFDDIVNDIGSEFDDEFGTGFFPEGIDDDVD